MAGGDDERSDGAAAHDGAPAYPRAAGTTRGPASRGGHAPGEQALTREQMVERHLSLAHHLARRYSDSGEPLDDLVQVASLGLVKAIDRFDPSRGVAFTTFAVPTILGELRRHFRDHGWSVRVPRDLKDASLKVTNALRAHAGRAPTPAQLASETGLSIETVVEALEVAGAHRALSLDAPAGPSAGEESGLTLLDQFGGEDEGLANARDRATLERLMRVLDPREREILRLRFEEDLTQSEIGERVGVSQMQISRLIRGALTRMREVARTAAEPEPSVDAGSPPPA